MATFAVERKALGASGYVEGSTFIIDRLSASVVCGMDGRSAVPRHGNEYR